MPKLSTDLGTLRTLHPREAIYKTAPLASVNAETFIDCDGASVVTLDLRGTFSLTIAVEGTADGTNWTLIPVRPLNVASVAYVASVAGAVAGVWVGSCAAYRQVRARVTAYTSGSATTTIVADNAVLDPMLQGRVATAFQTATAAAGSAVTLTLAAPTAGLRHYITNIDIEHSASALLVAAAVPVIVTTTNIPTSATFGFRHDAAVAGTMTYNKTSFGFPGLAVSAQNTATTIVCPGTASVIWAVKAAFYVAP